MNGHLLVSRLTALFSRLTANTGGLMNQDHSRLHLVTMLTSWPATPLTPDDTRSEQFWGRQVRRMNVGLHGVPRGLASNDVVQPLDQRRHDGAGRAHRHLV